MANKDQMKESHSESEKGGGAKKNTSKASSSR